MTETNGKNVMDWAIRSQDPKLVYDESKGKVQRLDGYRFYMIV
jgi:hypothetical protein